MNTILIHAYLLFCIQLNLYKQDSEMAQQFKEFMTDQISSGEDLSKAYIGMREMVAQLDQKKTYGGLAR